jgi:hypothetical protein
MGPVNEKKAETLKVKSIWKIASGLMLASVETNSKEDG